MGELVSGVYLDDEGLELVEFGALQDGAEGHDGGVAVAPVGVLDVLLDEGQHVGHHVILATGGQQHQAHARRLARVPVVIVVILVLTDKRRSKSHGGKHRHFSFILSQVPAVVILLPHIRRGIVLKCGMNEQTLKNT